MPRHPLLSDAQRSAILNAHFHLDDRDIARYWTLSEKDLDRINRRRRDWNRFGFAVQLCLLRFPGWPPKHQDRIPPPLLSYVGQQLEIPDEEIEDYFRRQPTRSEHLQELIDLIRFQVLYAGRGGGVESLALDAGPALGISGSAGDGLDRGDEKKTVGAPGVVLD